MRCCSCELKTYSHKGGLLNRTPRGITESQLLANPMIPNHAAAPQLWAAAQRLQMKTIGFEHTQRSRATLGRAARRSVPPCAALSRSESCRVPTCPSPAMCAVCRLVPRCPARSRCTQLFPGVPPCAALSEPCGARSGRAPLGLAVRCSVSDRRSQLSLFSRCAPLGPSAPLGPDAPLSPSPAVRRSVTVRVPPCAALSGVPAHSVRARHYAQRARLAAAPAVRRAHVPGACALVNACAMVAHVPAPASAHPPPTPKPATAAPAPAHAHASGAPRIHRPHPRPRIHRRTRVRARASTVPAHAVRARHYAQRILAAAPAVRRAHAPGACALVNACAMVRPTLRCRRVPPSRSRWPGVRVRRRAGPGAARPADTATSSKLCKSYCLSPGLYRAVTFGLNWSAAAP